METTHRIWDILEDEMVLDPYSGRNSSHISNAILFDISSDDEDGTYPRVSDYTRLANRLDDEGTYVWVNRLTRKKNKKNIDYGGCKIERSADYETEAIIEFESPVPVVFGYIGETPIVKEVKKIKGEFTHDWFWLKNGRQDRIANGFEIWFNINEFIE